MRSVALIILFLLPFFSFSQKNINRYKHKERQGLWIIYQDSTNNIIDNIGRYRKGIPKGAWRYYDAKGNISKTEKHFFKTTYITYYYPNGKIQKKGKAKTVLTDKYLHYYYYGNWNVYDTSGTLIAKQIYKEGNRVSEICYSPGSKIINDSLVKVIRQMNTDIYKYSDSLLSSENKYGQSSKEYQRYLSLSNLTAIKVFDDLDKLISVYGYPGKSIVGDDYALVFSIISSANLHYKEKYYDIILKAADEKELDWTDVAFFVDKVKVAKKEKQIYGTQFKFNENSVTYYPIEEKEKLNERRKKVGLDEMDISEINDTQTY